MNAHLRRTFYLFVAGFVGIVIMLWVARRLPSGGQTMRTGVLAHF